MPLKKTIDTRRYYSCNEISELSGYASKEVAYAIRSLQMPHQVLGNKIKIRPSSYPFLIQALDWSDWTGIKLSRLRGMKKTAIAEVIMEDVIPCNLAHLSFKCTASMYKRLILVMEKFNLLSDKIKLPYLPEDYALNRAERGMVYDLHEVNLITGLKPEYMTEMRLSELERFIDLVKNTQKNGQKS